jgi:hypothetical protein
LAANRSDIPEQDQEQYRWSQFDRRLRNGIGDSNGTLHCRFLRRRRARNDEFGLGWKRYTK